MKEFNKNKIAQFVLFIFGVLILSFLSYNSIQLKTVDRINSISSSDNINYKNVSPQELYNEVWHLTKNNFYKKDLNHQDWIKWKKRYKNKIKTMEDANVAINTMMTSLNDSYSKFLTEDEFKEQNRSVNSKLYGIGINVASISGKIYIVNVLKNAPADEQGVLSGDIILKINDTDVAGQSVYQAAQLIKGDEDAAIDLTLMRGNEKMVKTIKREEIKVKTIDYKTFDDIGYIKISSFIGFDTTKDFIVALNKIKDTKGLIIDLRGNAGGLFQNAVTIADLFLKKGNIVNVLARYDKKNIYSATSDGYIYDKPLVILIDEDTASASEILSSALHDNNRATLIGTRTFGKGLVQKVFSLPNKTGINLTIARYLTPNGKDINQKGIEPDYNVTITHNDVINNMDPQLNFARNFLIKEAEN